MAKVWVLQHSPTGNLGVIAEALESAALAWQYVRVFDGRPVPTDMKGAGGLIVMGGVEAVYQLDRYPYLRAEMALIENALKAGRPVLGVCLGSQLLAAAPAHLARLKSIAETIFGRWAAPIQGT
jgi:GMP synthase (glutamine-hydrolysing)